MKTLIKNFAFILIIFLTISAVFSLIGQPFQQETRIPLSQLVGDINGDKVKQITVSGDNIEAIYQDGTKAESKKETESSFSQSLINYGVDQEKLKTVQVELKSETGILVWLTPISLILFPILIFGMIFWMIFKQAKSGAMQAFDSSKARARLFGAEGHAKQRITFQDVAGLKEAKEELKEVVDFLKNPKKFLNMGARIPRGVLLMGAPGTGKTLLARAVAGEAYVPFFHISGSEFVEMFVGVGAGRVRDLFATAKKSAPAIIFIDELDAVGRHRGAGLGGGHDEREQTLNQILVEMDGFERDTNVIVIAATNRPDILDPALLRPGRFDRRVTLDLPDINDRENILKVHSKNKPLADNVDLRRIGEMTPGFSGADLANLLNESAILAALKNKKEINLDDILRSVDKILLGPERKSHILNAREKKITAYHEAGHALVAHELPNTDKVRKVSIIARGMAAGFTLKLPSEDKKMHTRSEFIEDLSVLLAGRIAEEEIFGEVTTGAQNDLMQATKLAKKIITEFGMNEKTGLRTFGQKEELIFLGRELHEQRDYSEKSAELIDEEIARLIKEAADKARQIITEKKKYLDEISIRLLEKETLETEQFEEIFEPATPAEPKVDQPAQPKPDEGVGPTQPAQSADVSTT